MNNSREVYALSEAYIALLQMPHGALREKNQHLLSALRDAVAEAMDVDDESAQIAHEHLAAQRAADAA